MSLSLRPVLFIDTADCYCRVAFLTYNQILAESSIHTDRTHVEKLAPQLKILSEKTNLLYKNLQEIFVNIGPGSFTGIRIGVAFARSLALALNIPVYGLSTLEALALKAQEQIINTTDLTVQNIYIFAIIPAYHEHFYRQIFNIDSKGILKTVQAPALLNFKQISESLNQFSQKQAKKIFLIEQISEDQSLQSSFAHDKVFTTNLPKIRDFQNLINIYKIQGLKALEPVPLYLRDAL